MGPGLHSLEQTPLKLAKEEITKLQDDEAYMKLSDKEKEKEKTRLMKNMRTHQG